MGDKRERRREEEQESILGAARQDEGDDRTDGEEPRDHEGVLVRHRQSQQLQKRRSCRREQGNKRT